MKYQRIVIILTLFMAALLCLIPALLRAGWQRDLNPQETIKEWEDSKDTLPAAYDYRQEGRAPHVKNQGNLGTCWAFASLMALESSLMPEEVLDFSEDHMTLRNSFGMPQDMGGEYTMSMAYLLSWQGPVSDQEDPYGDEYSPEGLKPIKHVQEIQILPAKDYVKIKKAVLTRGGVQSSLYTLLQNDKSNSEFYNSETVSYYYGGTEAPNHDVVIVGWQDDYAKENFNQEVQGDGAFLCINSWGEEFGDKGYFYVSYYDTNIGVHNISYTSVGETDNYSHIYQTDLCGWVGQLGFGKESAYFANVYRAGENEALKAAGFYATGPGTEYEIYISHRVSGTDSLNNRELIAAGVLEETGYYTIPFEKEIELKDGQRFAVIVKLTTPGAVHPVAIEYQADDGKASVDISDGEGYISLYGDTWDHVEAEQKCNICLKAYTVDR